MADRTKVTLSISPDTLDRAREAASRDGLTLSAWIDRAARREALRDAGTRYAEALAANPDIRAEVESWRAFGAECVADRADRCPSTRAEPPSSSACSPARHSRAWPTRCATCSTCSKVIRADRPLWSVGYRAAARSAAGPRPTGRGAAAGPAPEPPSRGAPGPTPRRPGGAV